MEKTVFKKYIDSPVGFLELTADERALMSVKFVERKANDDTHQPAILKKAAAQLLEYFEGKRKTFDLELAPEGSDFRKKVWGIVAEVPFGETLSYLDVAVRSGSEKNTRAVGLANGKNPIPIIIPCHRIIASDGKLTGYAGGLERKQWLLRHELDHSDKKGLLF